jgi:hypothetical protein
VIVAAHGGLRVKCRSRRIEVIAPPEDLALPSEPNEAERKLESCFPVSSLPHAVRFLSRVGVAARPRGIDRTCV